MGETKIEWATHTSNWIAGCSKISPACTHCYAETMTARLAAMPHAPARYRDGVVEDRRWTGRLSYDSAALVAAFPQLRRPGVRVFANSMSDTFHDRAPATSLTDLADAIKSMPAATPGVLMLLTKRPERMLAWQRAHFPGGLPSWVWVGTTVEDQQRADKRVPTLLEVRTSGVRFVSMEPLLGPVDLRHMPAGNLPSAVAAGWSTSLRTLDALTAGTKSSTPWNVGWVIAGGESGPGARPSRPDWFRSLRDQCAAAKVPFFFKQWGVHDSNGQPVGKADAGRMLDGRTWDEVPRG